MIIKKTVSLDITFMDRQRDMVWLPKGSMNVEEEPSLGLGRN